jgi:glycosyltransferase involved in cell wall biosynthesis
MKYWHAASFGGKSGISKYATVFFDEILSSRGYERLELDRIGLHGALDCIEVEDVVHVEIGVNQTLEIDLVLALCALRHAKIDVTLHDPPFLSWPLFRFKNPVINQISKAIHFYLHNFGIGEDIVRRLRKIYTLSNLGRNAVMRRYRVTNVYTMPLIVTDAQLLKPSMKISQNKNMLFFGYIGAGKSLGYALELHNMVLANFPESRFLVIGDAVGDKSKEYLAKIKLRYNRNVEYLGFVPDNMLHHYFDQATIAILPFANYRSIIPVSYSTISAMAMGKVVFTNQVNAIPELIQDGINGFFLTGSAISDSQRIVSLIKSPNALGGVSTNAINYLRVFHNPQLVGKCFDEC